MRRLYKRWLVPSYARREVLRKLALVGAVALLTATAASAAGGAGATLSSSTPGARNVSVTIVLDDVVLRCGRPSFSSLSLALPRAMRVPGSIGAETVRVGGKPVQSVRTDGKTIALLLPSSPGGVTCDSIVVGPLRIRLTRKAGLGNPARAGTYAFTVEAKPRGAWSGSFVVR